KAHLAKASRRATTSTKSSITNFFSKAKDYVIPLKTSQSSSSGTVPRLHPVSTSSATLSPLPLTKINNLSTVTLDTEPKPTPEQVKAHNLIIQIRNVLQTLPLAVPAGVPRDVWSRFSGDPVEELRLSEYEDVFELANKALHSVLGYGMTVLEIIPLIRRGEHGVEALCNWLSTCMFSLGLPGGILEARLINILDAAQTLCTNNDTSTHHLPPSETSPAAQLASPTGAGYNINGDIEGVLFMDPAASTPHFPDNDDDDIMFLSPSLLSSREQWTHRAPSLISCPGYNLILPEGRSPYTSYPFLLHKTLTLPWRLSIVGSQIFLHSTHCTDIARPTNPPSHTPLPCSHCGHLNDHNIVMGIRHRSLEGTHENTPWAYLTPDDMFAALERKTAELKRLRTASLNLSYKVARRNVHIDAWKRLTMSIGKNNIPRIHQLLAVEHRRGRSVYSMLEKLDRAARRAYRPRGYQRADFERSFLIYKLGGRAAVNIAQRSLGVPSIDATKRNIASVPLRSSHGVPAIDEMKDNLAVCYPALPEQSGMPRIGMSMQVDEIKVQERLRWDPRSNMILGVCREHGHRCALEFRTITQADHVRDCLRQKDIHLATEATVIAASILSQHPAEYTTKPFVISGSCKQELTKDQESLLRAASDALMEPEIASKYRLYCIASDGDSRRRRALIALSLHSRLAFTSEIHPLLSRLSLFNIFCGSDDLTPDFDWKHVLKRFRNTLLRLMGFLLHGTAVSASIIKAHLLKEGYSSITADALLAPNDKQDVVLMIKLLYAVVCLPPCGEGESPTTRSTRRVLRLLGRVYFNLLQPYLNTTQSLDEQLSQLSTAAHLILALYNKDKGEFIPVQLFFDVMSMIKNVYFSVAKTQIDNPDGSFWIILLGTDGLEKVFGMVRTMVGNDTHADVLQLTNRIDGAVMCTNILENHPEWGGDSRRLQVKPLPSGPDDISSKYDHINPKSCTGDLQVKNIVLLSCWQRGREAARSDLMAVGIDPPFDTMDRAGGYDILCPFGAGKMVLVDGLIAGERDETEEEWGDPSPKDPERLTPESVTASPVHPHMSASTAPDITTQSIPFPTTPHHDTTTVPLPETYEPDLDDLAGEAEVVQTNAPAQHSAWISVDDGVAGSSRKVHKASVLRLYSSPMSSSDSKDRLKRVRGYTQYTKPAKSTVTPPTPTAMPTAIEDGLDSLDELEPEDPALILVRSRGQVFLAVFQVLSIRQNLILLPRISSSLLNEPGVQIHGQIMTLIPRDTTIQPDGPDWEWNGSFEPKSVFRAEGALVRLINPDLLLPLFSGGDMADTFVFRTSVLRGLAASMYEKYNHSPRRLFDIVPSTTFPYRSQGGACFVCEKDTAGGDSRHLDDDKTCRHCPRFSIESISGPDLIKHMSAHILHDPRYVDADCPCGLCLRNDCEFFLITRGSTTAIDMDKSRCPRLRKFNLKVAAEYSDRSPCTNHPLRCPLCPGKGSPAIWKYNLRSHIVKNHPTANPDLAVYAEMYRLCLTEDLFVKGSLTAIRRVPKKRPQATLSISEGHSTRMALRETLSDIEEDDGKDIDENEVDIQEHIHCEPEYSLEEVNDIEDPYLELNSEPGLELDSYIAVDQTQIHEGAHTIITCTTLSLIVGQMLIVMIRHTPAVAELT
ncbi:hypothetical protein DXG01_005403, partial [Tephrocybe rancida]